MNLGLTKIRLGSAPMDLLFFPLLDKEIMSSLPFHIIRMITIVGCVPPALPQAGEIQFQRAVNDASSKI